ncbi:uncharacterized protein LOC114452117 isoform X7 [Parambassis ranga]|uniref:Uncharacterized protein LOC114452117 isoform X7 n=1 Tax=Parambassis ranga TaxID=210632 RepID=A0A6P7KCB9_9TELE|nr:uncharacterized protein LOC114452117 isoform X7 [Parambassis ranga]
MESLGHWSYEETQALIGVWSEDKIQQDLEESFRNEKVYREVSERLAAIGMSRSAKQCRDKIKKLKEEYRKIKKESERSGAVRKTSRWYNAMDAVMSNRPGTTDQSDTMILEFMISDVETDSSTITDIPGGCAMPGQSDDPQESGFYSIKVETDCDGPSTSTAVTSTAVQTTVKDTLCCWSHKEVQALLTLWANPAIQQELLLKVRNNKVYNCLSAQMESLGFNKTPKKCREKIKKLKQEYKRIKNGHHMGGSSSVWFAIMDEVLSSHGEAADCSETAELSFAEPSVHAQLDVWDVNTSDEAQWSSDEVQVLMTLWAQHNIQKQLLTSETINQVFTYLSNELALIGFNKTPHQCRLKVDNLKAEYKRIKQVEPHREIKSDWFAILDSVIGPGPELSAPLTEPKSGDERSNDTSHSMWSSEEVKVLLTCWAEESVQEELRTTPRNERVFAHLSSELAMQGFNKTTSQCRSKIRVLKQKYKKVKEQKDLQKQKSRWFTIMDGVLRRCSPEADAELAAKVTDSDPDTLQVSSQQDLNEPARGCHLSFSSLCLLVPTLRLMSAFAWQVIQCCNVAHYRKVEELLKVVTEMIPELLTPREKVQLLLRLRARLVLEFCVSESTANLLNIQPHLKVIQGLTISSSCDREVLEELENSKSNFVEVVHTLLEDPEERKRFFKEVFPIYYGQQFEVTLQALVWKFLSRLDNLLPIPDIKQTAEWLSSSPSLMEECGEMVLDPDQLKEVLHFHQKQTGSINTCLFQPQNMFLPLLSLHPKSNSKQPFSKEASTGGEEEAQLDYEDEEPVEEHRADDNEVLKIKEEEESDEYLQLQTCSMCPYSDSQVSGLLQHIRAEHLTQEFSHLPSKEPGKEGVFQTYSTHTPEKGITAKILRQEVHLQGLPERTSSDSHRRDSILVFALWPRLQVFVYSCAARSDTHRRATLQMSHLWKDFNPTSGETHAHAQRRKELSVYCMWEGFSVLWGVKTTHEVSHRRAALHMQILRERFHRKVLADSAHTAAHGGEALQVFIVS